MENNEGRRAINALEVNIRGAQTGAEGSLEAIVHSSLEPDLIRDSLARVIEDAAEGPRYAAWRALLEQHPDPVWLKRRFGDHPDQTISTEAVERKASLDALDAQLENENPTS